jgi:hypothetical protein
MRASASPKKRALAGVRKLLGATFLFYLAKGLAWIALAVITLWR